jgi:hypothetical protein
MYHCARTLPFGNTSAYFGISTAAGQVFHQTHGDGKCAVANILEIIAALVGGHNFLTFHTIEKATNLSFSQIIALKIPLEEYLQNQSGSRFRIFITSRIDIDPPGLFFED